MEKTYIIIEACYHVSYLMKKLSDLIGNDKFSIIVRDKKDLDAKQLNLVHEKYKGRKDLTADELLELSNAYKNNLSKPELELINLHGVPEVHVLSFPIFYRHGNINNPEIQKILVEQRSSTKLSAAIFLDCLLKDWWIDTFYKRIVNVHSAILPHARGMYAIEQTAAQDDNYANFVKSAGASIHYIDSGVDTGSLIATKKLEKLFECENIWQVKAESYLLAFSLFDKYVRNEDQKSFTHTDVIPYTDPSGPEYRAATFKDEIIRKKAEDNYKKYQEKSQEHQIVNAPSILVQYTMEPTRTETDAETFNPINADAEQQGVLNSRATCRL